MFFICRVLSVFISCLLAATVQGAPVFSFSFSDDSTDYMYERTHVQGTVTGLMYGLAENGAGQLPTSIRFTSSVAFLGMTDAIIDSSDHWTIFDATGFNIINGTIVFGKLGINFTDPMIGGLQFRLNGSSGILLNDEHNVLHWNGSSGPIVGTGNRHGFSGAEYALIDNSQVPEPISLALAMLALTALAIARLSSSFRAKVLV